MKTSQHELPVGMRQINGFIDAVRGLLSEMDIVPDRNLVLEASYTLPDLRLITVCEERGRYFMLSEVAIQGPSDDADEIRRFQALSENQTTASFVYRGQENPMNQGHLQEVNCVLDLCSSSNKISD